MKSLLYDPPRDRRTRSLTELVSFRLGIDTTELLELAQDRERWSSMVNRYTASLSGPATSYVPVTDPNWQRKRERVRFWEDAQFVEEGRTPYDFDQLAFRGTPHFQTAHSRFLEGATQIAQWYGLTDVESLYFGTVGGTTVHAYTDGSRLTSGTETIGAGAGVVFIADKLSEVDINSVLLKSLVCPLLKPGELTNNVGEITAMIAAVRCFIGTNVSRIVIHTDSSLVWGWFHTQRDAMRLSGYAGLLNRELWKELDGVISLFGGHVYVVKVRSHNNNIYNDEADLAAHYAATTSCFLQDGSICNPPDQHTPNTESKECRAKRLRSGQARGREQNSEFPQMSCRHTGESCLSGVCGHRCRGCDERRKAMGILSGRSTPR